MTRNTMIGIVAILIIVIAIGALFVLPKLTGSGLTPPSITKMLPGPTTVTTPGSVVIVKETKPPEVPTSGVWVHIIYIGSWKATYTISGTSQTIENSGERYYEIPNAVGKIDLVAEKLDSSTKHSLVAEIVKNGISLTNGSTNIAYGNISLSADTGTPPVTLVKTTIPTLEIASLTTTLTNTPVTTSTAGRTPAPVTSAPVCPSDKIACNGVCTETRTDNMNCGYCGNSCPEGKNCQNGNCAVSCSSEQTSCFDGCFNLMTDPKHCGTCVNSCPNGLICSKGRCDSPATPMPVPQ